MPEREPTPAARARTYRTFMIAAGAKWRAGELYDAHVTYRLAAHQAIRVKLDFDWNNLSLAGEWSIADRREHAAMRMVIMSRQAWLQSRAHMNSDAGI